MSSCCICGNTVENGIHNGKVRYCSKDCKNEFYRKSVTERDQLSRQSENIVSYTVVHDPDTEYGYRIGAGFDAESFKVSMRLWYMEGITVRYKGRNFIVKNRRLLLL